jgi:hypothetical protein
MKHPKSLLVASSLLIFMLGLNSAQAAISTRTLTEKNATKVVAVKFGGRVQLSLHSMYWHLTMPPKNASLTAKGLPILKPIFPGPTAPNGCRIAGSGCGTQTWVFTATKVGFTHLIATRTTCGEAMRCTGTNGRFEVTVKVVR